MQILSGDIGGTKTRLAIFEVGGDLRPTSLIEETYPSARYDSLDILVDRFLEAAQTHCDCACFGIAGPVKGGRCETTNLPWVVEAHSLASKQSLARVYLINDLEATAWGIVALDKDDFYILNRGHFEAPGNAAVIAAGTGLGEAGMVWNGSTHYPFGTEGGHVDFSPGNSLEIALLEYLSECYGHVSWERVLSGPGLVNIYEFICKHQRAKTPTWLREEMQTGDPAAAISRAALAERCYLCSQALDLFIHLYGVEAGNLALKMMATAGLYVGGGIAPKIIERIKTPLFMQAFTSKGRMQALLEAISIKVILNDKTALLGPAIYAARMESQA
jgi:glucokinase